MEAMQAWKSKQKETQAKEGTEVSNHKSESEILCKEKKVNITTIAGDYEDETEKELLQSG